MGEIADKFVTDFLGALPPKWSSNLTSNHAKVGRAIGAALEALEAKYLERWDGPLRSDNRG